MKMAVFLFLLAIALPAGAELSNVSEEGFTVTHSVETGAAPFVVYRTLTSHINQWWSEDHSVSGNAANLFMKVERGGCFCEKLPAGGNVEHLSQSTRAARWPLPTMCLDTRKVGCRPSPQPWTVSSVSRSRGSPDVLALIGKCIV